MRQKDKIIKHEKTFIIFLLVLITFCTVFQACAEEEPTREANRITLLDQQDRNIECHPKDPKQKKGVSIVTGQKIKDTYQPVLVEFNNENAGIETTTPYGINNASIIYEYQTNTNGTMGICALFLDKMPSKVGPLGPASVGGAMIQDEWKCAYVYHGLPLDEQGYDTDVSYSLKTWFAGKELIDGDGLYPASVSKAKEWKACYQEDKNVVSQYRYVVDLADLNKIIRKNAADHVPFSFLSSTEEPSDTPVREVDISTASRTFSSGFVYDPETKLYSRWIGKDGKYVDGKTKEQLTVSNVIIQRIDYTTLNRNMAPITSGKGNADIFMLGCYIEGYWVKSEKDGQTRYFDTNGKPIQLQPGTTFISLQQQSTAIVLIN